MSAFDRLGGDVVTKPLFGSEGKGLRRLRDRREAAEHFAALEEEGAVIYQQEFVAHEGRDLRALVVGAEVAGAMARIAEHGWITNVARGGRPAPVELDRRAAELALTAARAVGAEIAAVDLLPAADGRLLVLEVNAVPGWRALQTVCARDLATAVLAHVTGGGDGEGRARPLRLEAGG